MWLPLYWWELECGGWRERVTHRLVELNMGLPLYWRKLECGGWRGVVTPVLVGVRDGVTTVLEEVRVWIMEG